eukprot:TRINITY_DN3898_c0_g1_i1.p1 TRINITY_DN3898_c0_g1~~TRINITY_DN3898_c0_g1_i1.p1  ORF type:complete len:980 (+),score=246.88 TRINITY_DN3898_c0_g1_i1:92-2941(+)
MEVPDIKDVSGDSEKEDLEEGNDEEEGGEWEDWRDDEAGEAVNEDESESPAACLFCEEKFPDPASAFDHCAARHGFDFRRIRNEERLDFYDCIRALNYIRRKMLSLECIFCSRDFTSRTDLLEHMADVSHYAIPPRLALSPAPRSEGSSSTSTSGPAWYEGDVYLTPVIENDSLLFGFEDEDENEDADVIIEGEGRDSTNTPSGSQREKPAVADSGEGQAASARASAAAGGAGGGGGEGSSQKQALAEAREGKAPWGPIAGRQHADEGDEEEIALRRFAIAQEMADALLAMQLEQDELRAELEEARKELRAAKAERKGTPTPHPTPVGSPQRQFGKEAAALAPPHSLKSLEVVREEDGEERSEMSQVGAETAVEADDSDDQDDEDDEVAKLRSTDPDGELPGAEDEARVESLAGRSPRKGRRGGAGQRGKAKGRGRVQFAAVAERAKAGVDSWYFNSYSAFGIHREMLSDKVRTGTYRAALVDNPSLLKDAVVMDVGCGTGILSLFAVQGGAKAVVAVDGSAKIASVARQVAQANGFLAGAPGDRPVITVVQGMVEDLVPAETLAGESTTKPLRGLSLDSNFQEASSSTVSEGSGLRRSSSSLQHQPVALPIALHSVDVLVSEWMGYCLLYESMLGSVLHARDKWLKPGGALLPDIAQMYVAGFGKGATSLGFWEDVYGFSMDVVGREVTEDAAQGPIVDTISAKDVITGPCLIQSLDLVTMTADDNDFTSYFNLTLNPKPPSPPQQKSAETAAEAAAPPLTTGASTLLGPSSTGESDEVELCYGLVVWFDTLFSERFCKEKPQTLSTSPLEPSTHWAQTLLTFRHPIALRRKMIAGEKGLQNPKFDHSAAAAVEPSETAHREGEAGNATGVRGDEGREGRKGGSAVEGVLSLHDKEMIGTAGEPAVELAGRISLVRSERHRSIDLSLETTAVASDGRVRKWPVQMFGM